MTYCHWLLAPSQISQEKSLHSTKIPSTHPFPSSYISPGSRTSALAIRSWLFIGFFYPHMQRFPAPPGSAGVICNPSRRVLYLPWDLRPGGRAWNTTWVLSFFDARKECISALRFPQDVWAPRCLSPSLSPGSPQSNLIFGCRISIFCPLD